MLDYDVVIIDSGVNTSPDCEFAGVCVKKIEDEFVFCKSLKDDIGHGTIINSIINKRIPQKRIFNIKLSGSIDEVDESFLIAAFSYVDKNLRCKVINVSLGVKIIEYDKQLYTLCRKIASKGICIVSAFDNDGCFSYPAAFDCVIGVDNSNMLSHQNEYCYVENSPINILAMGNVQHVRLFDEKTVFVGGSSIACAHISSILASAGNSITSFESAQKYLKTNALYTYNSSHAECFHNNEIFNIMTAVVFPFSKEMQAFLRFSKQLSFNIKGYYDVRQSGKVGRKLSSFFEEADTEETIKNIDEVDFTGVDTIILGHLDELNFYSGHDYRSELINIAIKEKINVYSFDPLEQYSPLFKDRGVKRYYPVVTKNDLPENTFGKLYKISKPVVGIFGTSSHQGKFSLQLALRNQLALKGYNVGTIGTEPHAALFGFDVEFPMGYNSTVKLEYNEIVQYLNNEINKICLEGKEVILTATQAQIIPFYYNNLLEFPSMQYFFAVGTNPDAVILCINYFDENLYIKNSIFALIGLTNASVLALVMYPITTSSEWGGISSSRRKITAEEYNKKAHELEEYLNIPVYMLGDEGDLNKLCENIIDFF